MKYALDMARRLRSGPSGKSETPMHYEAATVIEMLVELMQPPMITRSLEDMDFSQLPGEIFERRPIGLRCYCGRYPMRGAATLGENYPDRPTVLHGPMGCNTLAPK